MCPAPASGATGRVLQGKAAECTKSCLPEHVEMVLKGKAIYGYEYSPYAEGAISTPEGINDEMAHLLSFSLAIQEINPEF
uniref:Uncharacterized protein n=1 Tax=Sphaerodactylus townsendi TaxID=933632 RepID=A0ACB8EFB7_9SAUR